MRHCHGVSPRGPLQYNDPQMKRQMGLVAAIGLTLTAVILLPRVLTGLRDVQLGVEADAQAKYADASSWYERAARLLPWRADLWEPAGLAAFRAGDAKNAVRLLQLASEHAPLSIEGYVALGSTLWTEGQSEAAIAAWQAGGEIHPNQPALLDRLIAAYDHEGLYNEEEMALERRLAAGNDATTNYRLGLLLLLSDLGEATKHLRAAASLNPQYASPVVTLEAAVKAAEMESDSSRRMVVLGRALGLVDEWRLAALAFENAVSLDAKSAEGWAWLGESQQHTGVDGGPALEKALSLGPNDAVVHSLRALYWGRQGQYSSALQEQLQAAQLDPQNATMHSALGDAYAAAGDLVSALSAYQEATTLAPDDASTWRQLAAFCADSGVSIQEIGLPAALKASRLAPRDAQALDVLGWSYTQAGLPYTGRQTLLQALQLDPGLALAHLHLAETYLRIGDFTSAQPELEQAVELDQNGPAGQFALQLLRQYFP